MSIQQDIINARSPKPAHPVMDVFAKRFSPRVFTADPVTDTELASCFEAARLAPSGRNHQPWKFFFTKRSDPAFNKLITDCIPVRNQWADTASVLVVAAFDPSEPTEGVNRWAQYDLGSACMSLVLEAQSLGISCRQVGSFDLEKLKQSFPQIAAPYEPLVVLVLGKMGTESDYSLASPELVQSEQQPWSRKEQISEQLN